MSEVSEAARLEIIELPKETAALDEWAAFCSDCFSYKPNPPPQSYFLGNIQRDPHKSGFSKIYVLREENVGPIVSTVRLLEREIWITSEFYKVIGVADVCTSVMWRRRGLSRKLLEYAIRDVSESEPGAIMLLHAAEPLQPLYELVGFRQRPTMWCVVQRASGDHPSALPIQIEAIGITSALSHRLCTLSGELTESFQLTGAIRKTESYYSSWIAGLSNIQLICIFDRDVPKTSVNDFSNICFFAVVGLYKDRMMLRDLGMSRHHSFNLDKYLDLLLQFLSEKGLLPADCGIVMPSKLGESVRTSSHLSVTLATTDLGWMIRCDRSEVLSFSLSHLTFWTSDHF
jgi:hypothetical protein